MLLYKRRLEGAVRELVRQHEFETAAETLSPENVGKAYAMGLDAIQERLNGAFPNFDRAAGQLVAHINKWIASAEHEHYDYIRAMKNPDFSLKAKDVIRLIKYTNDPSASKILLDLMVEVGKGFFAAQPDIKRSAKYLGTILELEDQVEPYIYGDLWSALQRDLSS